ncbi:5'-nucleotidase, lipoprotein e(P4) family [Vineibacter terrae]|uniref:5'-nucleotidase, lipoprotein e(P4) family n=1 Tax=Vineibacter terrae TaxID=2586908 RepID=A0A5C8PTA6_9HYPH|nr:5'-nucleotidase, lipoprotein e(P4) family [Vineibacter terrae]TXL79547.1 5'-nucleotidase, lipoprotein e(P4) family [Vineibacter terrae]
MTMRRLRALALSLAVLAAPIAAARAQDGPAPHDALLATLWMQRSVEYKASCLAAYTLARIRLEQALADTKWTAAPAEQTGAYESLPPAVILDIDETVLDNSAYQVWMIKADQTFDSKTWTKFVSAEMSTAIPGALEFTKYADAKGIKVFYITNRSAEEEAPTRRNMERLGFPMGGNIDTFLMARERPDWGSAKGTRRAHVAKDYRVLLSLGDNFGDFVDAYRGSEADRLKVYQENIERWGREWIMLPNPSYGSFDTAPYLHDFKQPRAAQRKAKLDVLQGWPGP